MTPSNQIIFDGFNFADYNIVITDVGHLKLAPRINQMVKIANRDGFKLVQSNLGSKPITISGYYIGTSVEDAQAMYDTLAGVLNRQARPLNVPHRGASREYTATPENLDITQPDGLNRLVFSFEFIVPDGYSTENETTELVNATITTASSTIPLSVNGSVVARPLITLTFDTVTGGTSKSVTIRNARDFVGLTIERTFTSGDTITIDSDNLQIYINDVLTEPSGRFPKWSPGYGALFYSDTFTTRSVDIQATYTEKNL